MALPVVDTEYLKEVDKARRDLRALISSRNCAPIMLRLAYPLSLSLSLSLSLCDCVFVPLEIARNENEGKWSL
jgi:hypothetical protein